MALVMPQRPARHRTAFLSPSRRVSPRLVATYPSPRSPVRAPRRYRRGRPREYRALPQRRGLASGWAIITTGRPRADIGPKPTRTRAAAATQANYLCRPCTKHELSTSSPRTNPSDRYAIVMGRRSRPMLRTRRRWPAIRWRVEPLTTAVRPRHWSGACAERRFENLTRLHRSSTTAACPRRTLPSRRSAAKISASSARCSRSPRPPRAGPQISCLTRVLELPSQ